MISFKNKNVLITGATGGIGNELVKKFISLGANVLGSGTKIEKLDLLKKNNSEIKIKKFDISEHSRIEEFIDNVTLELGGLDILVNNAGTNVDTLSLRMKDEEWKKVIDINLTSTFLLSKHAIKKMMKGKFGRIVNITSVVGHTGNVGQANYAASKAGIIGMSKSLAAEYSKKNITVNCVSPGFIVSDMTMNIAEKVKIYLTSRIPMGRLGTGEDVSNCVAFLSSEQASYITGETMHVNGGMYMA
jgi:3-oxoacyl-[acyl-carrier protein] reductase